MELGEKAGNRQPFVFIMILNIQSKYSLTSQFQRSAVILFYFSLTDIAVSTAVQLKV